MSAKLIKFRSVVCGLSISSFLLAQLVPVMAQGAARQDTEPAALAPVAIEQCRELSDEDVRKQLQTITRNGLVKQLGIVDYRALVEKHWRNVNMSQRLDREIDEAIRIVRADTTILDRAYSTVSKEKAEKTAIAVSERAFGSEGFRAGIADLANGVGEEFGQRLETASEAVAGPVIACVRTALQSRYGDAVAQIFERETEEKLNATAPDGGAKIKSSDLVLENMGSISGIVLIVSRRIIARMVATIGRRVAGLVASRIVSSFTGLLGLALIVRDLYQASEGVFPLIEERMKSPEAKSLIKEELAKSIRTDLTGQIDAIGEETAERINLVWLDFKKKYNLLLSLAEKNDGFAAFLKLRKTEELGRLGRIVSLIVEQESEEKLFTRVGDGSLRQALDVLNDEGVALAEQLKSFRQAMKWSELAGSRLPKVVEYGLTGALSPDALNRDQLTTLLSLNSRAAALRIAEQPGIAREALLALPPQTLRQLSVRLSESELAALAAYIKRLDKVVSGRILRRIAEDPDLMQSLDNESVREAVIKSRDQLSAVNMLLRDNSALNLTHIGADLGQVRNGDVHYRVFVQRYWIGIVVIGLVTLLLLMALKRMITGNRPATVIIKTADGKKKV